MWRINLREATGHFCGRSCLAFKCMFLETSASLVYECQTATRKHNLAYVGVNLRGEATRHFCGRNCLAFKCMFLGTFANLGYEYQTATRKHNLAYATPPRAPTILRRDSKRLASMFFSSQWYPGQHISKPDCHSDT